MQWTRLTEDAVEDIILLTLTEVDDESIEPMGETDEDFFTEPDEVTFSEDGEVTILTEEMLIQEDDPRLSTEPYAITMAAA